MTGSQRVIGVGLVGYGYWGPNLLRNFWEVEGCSVRAVCDTSPDRLARAQARYPAVTACTDFDVMLEDPNVDAIVIATPLSTHFDLSLRALHAGKHVWVEKPMTETSEQAERLVAEAQRRGLTLMVDHVFLFSPAVRKIREVIESGDLGQIYYYDSIRVNLGLFQHDTNVIWDLAVHDLAIMDHVLGSPPSGILATGIANLSGHPENLAYITVFFDTPVISHIQVNWLAPVKIRQTFIGGDRRMIVYDDLEPSEKIKIYDRGVMVSAAQMRVDYRTGDMWAPRLGTMEPLREAAVHFVDCIQTGRRPIADGESGLRIVRMLEAAEHSMKQQGLRIDLSPIGA